MIVNTYNGNKDIKWN